MNEITNLLSDSRLGNCAFTLFKAKACLFSIIKKPLLSIRIDISLKDFET